MSLLILLSLGIVLVVFALYQRTYHFEPNMSPREQSKTCFQFSETGKCRFSSACKFSHDSTQSGTSRKQKRSVRRRASLKHTEDYIQEFFTQYEDFDYDPAQPVWDEFNRMRDLFGWHDDEDFETREAKRNFKSAMVQQFNRLYGSDENNLESWQNLCRILNIQNVPQGLKECRKVMRQTHVNLVDLVDSPRTGEPVAIFGSLKELREYTIETEKIFPKENAYSGGLLRYLLPEIF